MIEQPQRYNFFLKQQKGGVGLRAIFRTNPLIIFDQVLKKRFFT